MDDETKGAERNEHLRDIGRAVFGLGAIITWLCTIGYAVAGARKLLRRSD